MAEFDDTRAWESAVSAGASGFVERIGVAFVSVMWNFWELG
jgi:hypothetical protein